jgi:CHAD domain-containing protein
MEIVSEALLDNASSGLDYWMAEVSRQCENVRRDFAPDPVHDLRVALRRCRSIADGFISFDPDPAWTEMKSESKRLFGQLGALRDAQVMMGWAQRLAPETDRARIALTCHLQDQEIRLRQSASDAVQHFNCKKWTRWTKVLSSRTRRIPPESIVFQNLALERWLEARQLHRDALRNRSQVAFHRLRIGLKKFRYTVENFLPARHELWGAELREIQDLLGEMHDLHMLWQTAIAIRAIDNERTRLKWRNRISEESNGRLRHYRDRMLGKDSLWLAWRSGLPDCNHIKSSAMARLRTWALFRDPEFLHSEHVAKLALQLYDGLQDLNLVPIKILPDARYLLEGAALAHDVGRFETQKKHHLASARMIRKLKPPPGWDREKFRQVSLIVRFHRGALPRIEQNAFEGFPQEQRKGIVLLAGILRLAAAFDRSRQRKTRRLQLKRTGDVLSISASGYSEHDAFAEDVAGARHLLETSCRLPILIQEI